MHLRELSGYSAREGRECTLWRWDRFADAPTQGPARRGPIRPHSQVRGGLSRRRWAPRGTHVVAREGGLIPGETYGGD